MVFGQKWVKILIVPLFQLKFNDVTMTLSLIVLIVMNFFYKLTLILSYSIPKFVKIECHFQDYKNKSTFAQF